MALLERVLTEFYYYLAEHGSAYPALTPAIGGFVRPRDAHSNGGAPEFHEFNGTSLCNPSFIPFDPTLLVPPIYHLFLMVDSQTENGFSCLRRIGVVKKIRGKNQDSSFEVGLIGYE